MSSVEQTRNKQNTTTTKELLLESKQQTKTVDLIRGSYASDLTKVQHLTCSDELSYER